MSKEELYQLLEEAGRTESEYGRRVAIFQKLSQALIVNANHPLDDYSEGESRSKMTVHKKIPNCQNCLLSLLHNLYWGCLETNPSQLSSLFPVFQALCGDLATFDSLNRLATIDWSWWTSFKQKHKK